MDKLKIALAGAALALVVGWCQDARAADKAGDKSGPLGFLPLGEAAKSGSWTGFYIGGYGSWNNVDTDTSPISLGSTGFTAGVTASAAWQAGSLVLEGFGEHGWFFGDLKDLGAKTETAFGGRVGYLANQNTMLYLLGAKSWVDTDYGTADGWQYGGGLKLKFNGTPTVLFAEFRHSEYPASSSIPIDLVSDSVRVGLTLQLGAK